MLRNFLDFLDWFIPQAALRERSDLGLARFFVFTHIFGPAMAQAMVVALLLIDPAPGYQAAIVIGCIWGFWVLPFVLRRTGNLQQVALISVVMLLFASLFGSYHYGGLSSPLIPWMVISLFAGFFYLSDRPLLVIGIFVAAIAIFLGFYAVNGFPDRVSLVELAPLGWISIAAATVYMSWIAVYYSILITMRSDLQKEVERHRNTATLLKATKEAAEQANRERSIFLAKMSHELRTPLNAIIGYSELLLEDVAPSDPRATDIKRISTAGKHLLSLVTDVLDISRIESNDSGKLRVETFSLARLLDDVAATVSPLVSSRGNRLVISCPPDVGDISTDAVKLRQSVLNLVGNASKFTEHGEIRVTVARERWLGDWIEIGVEDTGVGIDPADLPRLFRNFSQADTTGRINGTGLGLAITQRLCAMLGGGISVTSRLGLGSRFIIRVPAAIKPDTAPADDPATPAAATAAAA